MKRLIITAAALLICGCSDSDDTSSSAGISAAADSPAAVTTTTVTTVPPEQPMNSELPDESETVTTASQTVTSAPTQTTASASSAKQDKPLTADDLGFKNVDSIGSKYEFTYGGEVFTAIYTPDNWKIIDSYKIEKESDILLVCKILVAEHPVHGKDMISFDSDFTEIPAPYLFEASELNYINGTYVYTYNCDWSDHTEKWDYDCPAPSMCSMVYMTTKTPLDPESWEMKGECFRNPGLSGLEYSNNHTHMHKYKGKWYMFYHTLLLKKSMKINGGYRSLGVDEINVDEEKVTIEPTGGTKEGVSAADGLDPYTAHLGAELCSTAEITYDCTDMNTPLAVSDGAGSWTNVKNVVFSDSDTEQDELRFIAEVKGSGRIEVRLGAVDGELLTSLDFDSPDSFTDVFNKDVSSVSGTKDLYFVYSDKDIAMKLWQFDGAKAEEQEDQEEQLSESSKADDTKGRNTNTAAIAAGALAAAALAVGTAVFLKKRRSHK